MSKQEAEFHQLKIQILDWLSQYERYMDMVKFNQLLVKLCNAKLHEAKMVLVLDSEYQRVHVEGVQKKRDYIRKKIYNELGLDLLTLPREQVDRFYRFYERFLEICA